MSLPTIRTPRLVLRGITPSDTDALLRIFGDAHEMRYWGHPPLRSRADADALVAEIQAGASSGRLLQWGIAEGPDSWLMGTCTLADVDPRHRRAELGLALARPCQGRGYALEASDAVLHHAFGRMGLHRIIADVDPRNEPSLRLLRRLGFKEEGRFREHYWQNEEWQDGLLFGILRSEWGARPPAVPGTR